MNPTELTIALCILAGIVVLVTVGQLLGKWRDRAVEHERQRSWDRGRNAGYRACEREHGIIDRPVQANLLSWARWAERGCPTCKRSLFASWFGKKRGVLVFEFRCGALYTNENGGTCTHEGIDCQTPIGAAS